MKKEISQTLPLKAKISYAIGYFGKNALVLVNTYFLLYFYTDVIQIPAAAASIIMMIARIWDAVNDPMMGVIVDKTKSKYGKCRFWLRYLSVPAGVCIALSYMVPGLNESGRIIWVAVTYILQGMGTTAVTVPINTLLVTMTNSRLERVRVGQLNAIASTIGNFTVPALTLPLVNLLGRSNLQRGFSIFAVVLGCIYSLCTLVTYWGSKGHDEIIEVKEEKSAEENVEKVTIRQMLKVTVTNQYAVAVCVSYMLYLILSGIMGSTIVYYFQYNLHNTGLMSVYSTTVTAASIISIFTMGFFLKHFGNANACLIGAAVSGVACLLRFVTGDSVLTITIVSWALMGLGSSVMTHHTQQCIMDSTTFGKQKYNIDTRGIIMSMYTFAQKFGQAVGGVLAAAILAMVPYVPEKAEQEQSVLNLFYAENITIPLVLSIISVVLFAYIARLEKQMVKKQQEEEKELAE